jgi:4-diphosphocytidyl-2-C-methyl-D-erythritol kinase
MVIFPKAKINIGLRITEKRADGYHNLETVFYPVNLCDALEFTVLGKNAKKDILTVTGLPVEGNPENNLVFKALARVRDYCPVPFISIHLHKTIPTGAGLGGGSSDAASFLRVLNRYFCFRLDEKELLDTALFIGSDCPFFINSQPSYAEGRGEILSPVNPLPDGLHIVILKPATQISTREAFAGCIPRKREIPLTALYNSSIENWKETVFNDFEDTVFPGHPEIRELKEALYRSGAVYSSMTGSGASVYGIFRDRPEIPQDFSDLLVWSGAL